MKETKSASEKISFSQWFIELRKRWEKDGMTPEEGRVFVPAALFGVGLVFVYVCLCAASSLLYGLSFVILFVLFLIFSAASCGFVVLYIVQNWQLSISRQKICLARRQKDVAEEKDG